MKIYLTRHGETEWNLIGKMQGRQNSELTELGKQQADWLGERLKDMAIDVICSSPSGRAIETAQRIKGDRTIEIETYADLMEIHLGSWEGMYHDDIEAQFPEGYKNLWYHPEKFDEPDKENLDELIKRGGEVLERIIVEHPDKNILIVAHGVLLKAIFSYVKSLPLKEFWSGAFMKSCCLNILEVDGEERYFILEGDTKHYQNEK